MRTEQIMDAVVTAVTGLATTGTNVKRARVYDWNTTPALSVFMGQDSVLEELHAGQLNWGLTVVVASHVQGSADVDQTINIIRKEVHAALMADYTLGLGFVRDIEPVVASEPTLSAEGEQPIATQTVEFLVKYRTSRTALDA